MERWIWLGELGLRVLVATVFGGIIGIERAVRLKDAGIRTHSIIACSAALYMILSMYAYGDSPFETDTSILATQIIYGFAFMGAGIIIKDKHQIVAGLRTATGLWVTAAIGMACGPGLFVLAAVGTLVTVVVQTMFFRGQLDGVDFTIRKIRMSFVDSPELRAFWMEVKQTYGIHPYTTRYKRDGAFSEVIMRVRMEKTPSLEEVLALIDQRSDIISISI